MNDHHDSQDMRDLEPQLIKAVEVVRIETVPDDAVARVMERAKRLEMTVCHSSSMANEPVARSYKRSQHGFSLGVHRVQLS